MSSGRRTTSRSTPTRSLTDFNRFYEACHILREEDPHRQASWLAVVDLTLRTLTLLLDILGIEIPDRM